MLKGIPAILSPDLLKTLMEMGHGDEIVIGDGNFPAETLGRRVIRLDGHGVPVILEAILRLMPLDTDVERPVALTQHNAGEAQPEIWKTYAALLGKYEPGAKTEFMERYAFYERAQAAYAVIATGESAFAGTIILKKGVVK